MTRARMVSITTYVSAEDVGRVRGAAKLVAAPEWSVLLSSLKRAA